ncbi:MAG: hypothetical protein H6772_03555 [Pseudomonadales bacterium]|nr:hypothetical protein [Pseudomonadales bacterium]
MKNDFLSKLQNEALTQKKLNEMRIFPIFFDGLTSFVGIYSWQTLLILAIITTIFFELF